MITALLPVIGSIIDKLIPDPVAKAEAQGRIYEMAAKGELDELALRTQTIIAEANGESWLQRNWRPLTMITFVSLVVATWLGFTTGISEALQLRLMDIIELGLGGYVIGRSAEKIAPAIANALKR